MTARQVLQALAALSLLVLLPTTQAVEFPFGSAVGSSDYDFLPFPAAQRTALCFIDMRGDGRPTADDLLLLPLLASSTAAGTCTAQLDRNALVVNHAQGRAAGSEITGVDRWMGKPLASLTGLHAVRFWEEGTDASRFDGRDTLYIDLVNLAGQVVDAGDLRITASGTGAGGTFVASGDADLNRPLLNLGLGASKQIHDSNVVYKAGSAYYVNTDGGAIGGSANLTTGVVSGDLGVETNDVRLNPKAVNPLSDLPVVLPDRIEVVQPTVAPGQTFQVKITAKNVGRGAGSGLIETRIDDHVVDGRGTPTIEVNGVAVLTLTLVAPTAPGMHTVKAGVYTDFLNVEPATTPVIEMASEQGPVAATSNGAPGLGTMAFVGLLLGLVLWTRRA